jgi:hypothetical protein
VRYVTKTSFLVPSEAPFAAARVARATYRHLLSTVDLGQARNAPDAQSVLEADDEGAAVRGERHRVGYAVNVKCEHLTEARNVPELDGTVRARGGERQSVRRECQARDGRAVRGKLPPGRS